MKLTRRLCLLTALLASSAPLHAQPAAPTASAAEPDVAEARRRFQRGVELFKEGSSDAALAEFTKAYQLAPNYRVLYNLAEVQAERHDYVAAIRLFDKYLSQGAADISAERRAQVEQEIRSLRGKVSEVSIDTNVDGAELFVGGVSMGELSRDRPVLVNSGVRQFQMRKPGYVTRTRTLTIAGGESMRIELMLEPEPPSAPAQTPAAASAPAAISTAPRWSPSQREQSSRAPLWISLVSTGVFAGAAVTFAVLSREADQDLGNELERFPANTGAIEDARSELKRYSLLADGFMIATGAAGALSLYFALSGSKSTSPQDAASQRPQRSVRVAPHGTGIRVLGNF